MGARGVAALLLAAGESRRMGQIKALLPWGGETLIAYQLRQLAAAGLRPIVVVLGHRAAEVAATLHHRPEATLVENPLYLDGKTSSIRVGVGAVPAAVEALVIQAVDQPRRVETITALVAAHLQSEGTITVPTYRGRRGHPLVLSACLRQELLRLSEETQGLREVLRRHQRSIVEVPFGTPEPLQDLNTPEDYRLAAGVWDRAASRGRLK